MFTFEEAQSLKIEDIYDLYREFSNKKLPDVYKKFKFGQEVITKAQGSFLETDSGKKIFDFTGGLGVANYGHNHPRILEVRRKFSETMRPEIHKSYFNPFLAAASKNLADVVGHGLNYSFFCNSGAESVDGALKITYKRHKGKRKIVLHSNRSFHGKTLGAGSISAGDNFVGGKGRFFFQRIPGTMEYDFNNIDSIKSILESAGAENVYAIFVEPFSCSTLTENSSAYLKELREICDKHKISLVFDEIYSGFGKCGYDFYFHKYGVAPDVLCVSKALGGGKASTSAYLTKESVFEEAYGSISGALTHSTTYNSFGEECATVLESCNVLVEEKVSDNAKNIEKLLISVFDSWKEDAANPVTDFRGQGSHFGVILRNPFELLQPLAEILPVDFTSDPLFTKKLYTTAIANALWEDANCLCAFTSNQEVILNFSPSPLANIEDVKDSLLKAESVIKKNPLELVVRVVKNGMAKL
ncbi:aspartate aminotransferase family protein [Marinomonas foliarum]|uniref:Putrescine aminotransferase n=1 Tax=Marinomonas foliarum TaxID=491950 RepID=A0A368ZVN4_9GAMM|nr:aminotransferase class III-fold pyridoxal phosphate-dependent enzyme [Marinomonas foliarum]RCX00368.1 putrescine aminotransferase [Marinomonas foliarum]